MRQDWMTDDQWRGAQLIAEVFGGFHHLRPFKPCGKGVAVVLYAKDLGTWDFNHLTQLVILAHVQCIRISITTAGPRLEARAYVRNPNATSSFERHPTLREAIARYAPQEQEPGQVPRRFDDWHEDNGPCLWWNVENTGNEICEEPGYVGGPLDHAWPWRVESDGPHLLWVPLPKLARGKP